MRAGPGPRQQPLSDDDRATIANVTEEIRDAASELVEALDSGKPA